MSYMGFSTKLAFSRKCRLPLELAVESQYNNIVLHEHKLTEINMNMVRMEKFYNLSVFKKHLNLR